MKSHIYYHDIYWSRSYLYVVGNLVLTELGEDCESKGLQPIDSESKCTSATQFIKTYYPKYEFKRVESLSSFPKGCYVFIPNDLISVGYFNTHSTGNGESFSRAVCEKKTGK